MLRLVALSASLVAMGVVSTTPIVAQSAISPPQGQPSAIELPAHALLSPDGLRAAWAREDGSGFLFARRPSTAAPWSAAGTLEIRGIVRTPVFSPDGTRLAFENVRGGYPTTARYRGGPSFNWSYIAIYDFAADAISYVDPAFAMDGAPAWEGPDSVSFDRRMEGEAETRVTRSVTPRVAEASAADAGNLALLDALLSAPIAYQPVASADGRTLAFVAREGRVRTIYAAGVAGQARNLVRNGGDDGLELSQLNLSPDGRWLAYVRGGTSNAKGEHPNARSFPVPPGEQIWLVATDGTGAPRRIAAGHKPQFSPDGARILWQTPAGIAVAPLGADGPGPAEYLVSGPAGRLRISPDGKRIAYERSTHVELLEFGSRRQWALDKPSTATDSYPTWSPDGSRLAFVRTYGSEPSPDGLADQPWELVVADAGTRRAGAIWRAEPGLGSAFYPLDQDQSKNGVEQEQLLWSDGGEIAFAWERDGWRHLYAVPAAGGSARLLTPGDGEVEAAALSLDRKSILHATNIGDLTARRLWSLRFDGGAPQPASDDGANQWGATPLADGAVAMVQAGHAAPPSVVVRDAGGRTRAVGGPALPSAFPARRMVKPQAVSFTSPDGERAFGELFVPARPNGCGVIFIHGGSRRQMLLGFHYIDVYTNLYELNQYFAMRGCVVLSVEYRTGIMFGHAFRNAPARGDSGASEYQDVLGGLAYLRSRPELKVSKVGIYGLSYGGLLTAQALARDSGQFAVGFDMAGVHTYLGKGFQHSPAAFVDGWTSPVYFASGDDDRNVDHSQSILLYNAIRQRRPDLDVVGEAFPNEVHDIYLTMDNLVRVYWNGSQFMLKYLMPPGK